VDVVACDVGQRARVAGLLEWTAAGGPPLAAVMHTAGAGQAAAIKDATVAGLTGALAAGAAHLDELTRDMDLDAFVLFSSAVTIFGQPGQGNHAAASAFLDALARRRNDRGLPATSLAWGRWPGRNGAQASEAVRQRLHPLTDMDPDLALMALGQVLDGGDRALAVMDVDWSKLAAPPGAIQVPLLRDLPDLRRITRDQGTAVDPVRGELGRRLACRSGQGRGRGGAWAPFR
jgi:hypothetical protein